MGGPGLYYDQMHHFTVKALTDTTICFIDTTLFKEFISNNKAFANEFLKDFSRNTLSVYNRLINLTQKQMPGRMADTMLYLSTDIYASDKFRLHLSKQDLSDLSAMSKESAIKVLRDFQHEGLIRFSDHELEILNKASLMKISRFG